MKVYVNKNDIDVINDLFEATNSYECWACNRDDDLEIVSLSDYTKQVRKEVVQEIKEKCERTYTISPLSNKPKKEVLIIPSEILDQIEQGERNAKD